MPENPNPAPSSPAEPTPQPKPSAPSPEYGHVPMSEEFDKPRWTLPPMVPVLIAVAAVVIVIAVVSFTTRATPVAKGTITKVAASDQQGNTLAAVQVKLNNVIDKQLWIKSIDSEVETADGKKFTDHAAPSSDVQQYIQAFPALAEANADPLHEELKIPPKGSFTGVTVFSYPIDAKTFQQRKSLTLRIQMYDQPTVVVKQP